MKSNNFFKLITVFIVLLSLSSCKKKDVTFTYDFINGTEDYISMYIGKSVDIFKNAAGFMYKSGTMEMIFYSDLFDDSSVVFGYRGKFYEEKSLEPPSILCLISYYLCTDEKNNRTNGVFVITEKYIRSLPVVEMPTEN